MEGQMPRLQAIELASLEAQLAEPKSEEDRDNNSAEIGYLDRLFDEDLIPMMRYSFIVFLHTTLETHLRSFCLAMKKERQLPLGASDLSGNPLEQAKNYLTKLVGIKVGEFPQWSELKQYQRVRDCIVHHYGYLAAENSKHEDIRKWSKTNTGLQITASHRLNPSIDFCRGMLRSIDTFFRDIFVAAGWKP